MKDNKMKKIIKKEYTANPIINYLKYWSLGQLTYSTLNNDEWRKKYDLDVNWLEGDLHADTIFSFWIPLKQVLDYLNPNEKFYKKNKYGEDPNTFLDKIINNIDTFLPRNDVLVEKLYLFAELSTTRANVMRLPNRQMQVRGKNYFDQMPKTLFECFKGGTFYRYFNDDEKKVVKWIKEERLGAFFEGDIDRENIKPVISRIKSSEVLWFSEKDDLLQMLNNFIDILKARDKMLKEK